MIVSAFLHEILRGAKPGIGLLMQKIKQKNNDKCQDLGRRNAEQRAHGGDIIAPRQEDPHKQQTDNKFSGLLRQL